MATVVLAIAACSGSVAPPDSEVLGVTAEPEPTPSSGSQPAPDKGEPADPAPTEPPAGEPRSGFGAGSLVSAAGEYADRILDIDGQWLREFYTVRERPAVCGFAEPIAAEGASRTRLSNGFNELTGFIAVEVFVYGSTEEAAGQVSLLNGPNAVACDQAIIEELEVDSGSDIPFSMDFSSSIGTPVDYVLPSGDRFAYDSRWHESTFTIGSISQDFAVLETWVADGRFLVRVVAMAAEPRLLSDEMAEALFTRPAPSLIDGIQLDEAVDALRRATLSDTELPEIFELDRPATTSRRNQATCFTLFLPEARLNGPSWVAVSPGVGESRVTQTGAFFASEESAVAAFDQVVDLGLDCYLDAAVQRSDDDYDLVESSYETVVVDGLTVVVVKLSYDKLDGFDDELQAAIVRSGPFIVQINFLGLPGEAPDLTELARLAVEQLASE